VLDIFLKVILPVFVVVGIGAGYHRWRDVSAQVPAQITVYLLTPALIFNSLLSTNVPAQASIKVAGASLITSAAIVAGTLLLGKLLRQPRATRSAFVLVSAFPNSGNLALPVILLAYGDAALSFAVIIFVVLALYAWSVGVFIASSSEMGGLASLRQVFKMPHVYAVAFAFLVKASGWTLPVAVESPLELLGNAAIPMMLLVLGFQIGRGLTVTDLPSLVVAIGVRLIGAAGLAYGMTLAFGLDGVEQRVVIVMAAMPTAIFTTIVATQFRANPQFVTAGVVGGTLASLVTLTGLLALLD
jgi:hypothetical protein